MKKGQTYCLLQNQLFISSFDAFIEKLQRAGFVDNVVDNVYVWHVVLFALCFLKQIQIVYFLAEMNSLFHNCLLFVRQARIHLAGCINTLIVWSVLEAL